MENLNTLIIVLIILLVVVYYMNMHENFAANFQDQPYYASTDYDENIAGIDEALVRPITINDYANNLAYDSRDPESANYLVNGRRPWSPYGYPHPGNADGQTVGRQFAK